MKITLTAKEIVETPNDQDLGALVRQKYWFEKSNQDEHMTIVSNNSGEVVSINDFVDGEYDKCVICGKTSPYKTSTHVDLRYGYVDGAGQGCFQSHICNKENN